MNRKKSKLYRAQLAGALQLTAAMGAISFILLFYFFGWIVDLFSIVFLQRRLALGLTPFWCGMSVFALFLYCAVRNISMAKRCGKIQRRIDQDRVQAPIPLSELEELTGQPAEKLCIQLQIMVKKDYFSGPVQFDLYRRQLVPGAETPIPPPEPEFGDTFVYKEVTERSKFPYFVLISVAVICLLFSGFYKGVVGFLLFRNWYKSPHTFLILLLAGGSFALTYKYAVPYKRLVQRAGAPRPPVKTGDKEADDALESAIKQLERLRGLSRGISNPKIDTGVQQLLATSQQIFDYVRAHPEKLRQTRQFMNYYLPTTIKLLDSYVQFSAYEVKGENVAGSLRKIEDMIENIVKAFQKELDNLYYDKAIDISTEIDVMKSMLEQEGIGDANILGMDFPSKDIK